MILKYFNQLEDLLDEPIVTQLEKLWTATDCFKPWVRSCDEKTYTQLVATVVGDPRYGKRMESSIEELRFDSAKKRIKPNSLQVIALIIHHLRPAGAVGISTTSREVIEAWSPNGRGFGEIVDF